MVEGNLGWTAPPHFDNPKEDELTIALEIKVTVTTTNTPRAPAQRRVFTPPLYKPHSL
jgi:hypothetical protein